VQSSPPSTHTDYPITWHYRQHCLLRGRRRLVLNAGASLLLLLLLIARDRV